MARTYMTGFETGAALSDGSSLGTGVITGSGVSFDATIFRTGARSLKVAAVSAAAGVYNTSYSGLGYRRFYLRVTAAPATTARTIYSSGSGSAGVYGLRLRSDSKLELFKSGSSAGTSTTALTDTTRWYRVEIRAVDGVATQVLIDGTVEITGAAFNSGAGDFMFHAFGPSSDTVADTYTVYFDDYSVDDAAYPGAGAVALLVPTAQNSVTASTWQKPGGATTNMHTSVDNIPPVGVAASTNVAQAENQIRNAVSNAAADVVFAMTTYTAAGVGAGDTINATQVFAVTGQATTATTKTGSLATTNPTQAEVNFGAFGTGAAQGTFPANWQKKEHTITQAPSPTLGTAPTVTVGQRVANTTAAGVCFVGMYVDYSPAVAAARVPPRSPYPQLLAH
jgi:hypothetical protein